MPQDTFVLNEGRLIGRTSSSGKTRFHMRVVSEPLYIHTDAKALGKPVADAMAFHLKERVKGITASVSAATVEFRKKAAKAFMAGEAWAQKRYSGGRIGPMSPKPGSAMFNDSGRFAASIAVGAAKDDSWRVNVAANRLNDATTARVLWDRLIALVPEFADMRALMAANPIVAATIRVREKMIEKGRATDKPATVGDALRLGMKFAQNVSKLFAA
jgi:hypothetical protein